MGEEKFKINSNIYLLIMQNVNFPVVSFGSFSGDWYTEKVWLLHKKKLFFMSKKINNLYKINFL